MGRARFEECKEMLQIVPVMVSLCDITPQVLVCKEGVMHTVAACIAAAAATKKAKEQALQLQPGRDSWVVDSGSGRHLIQKSDCSPAQLKRAVKADEALILATANGHARAEWLVPCYVEELDIEVWAWLLTSTPKVLGLHLLVRDHRYRFKWAEPETATITKDRKTLILPVVQGVPAMKYNTDYEHARVSVEARPPQKWKRARR